MSTIFDSRRPHIWAEDCLRAAEGCLTDDYNQNVERANAWTRMAQVCALLAIHDGLSSGLNDIGPAIHDVSRAIENLEINR